MMHLPATKEWFADNAHYQQLALHRLRLLLKRRVVWLRSQWQHDPAHEAAKGVIGDAHVDWLLGAEDSAAEQDFYRTDAVARDLSDCAEETCQQMEKVRRQNLSNRALPLDVLAHLFGLGDFERDVLLLALAPELDPGFQPLFGYVQDNIHRTVPTIHLACALFGAPDRPSHLLQHAFTVDAPLRRYQLVLLTSDHLPIAQLALRLPERILDYLCGTNRPDGALQRILMPEKGAASAGTPDAGTGLTETLQQVADQLTQGIQAVRGQGGFPVVNLVAPVDGGQREVAACVATALHIHLFALDITQISDSAQELAALIALLEREALLLQCAYFLATAELDELPAAVQRFIQLAAHQAGILLFVASRDSMEASAHLFNVELPRLTSQDRDLLWRQALGDDAMHVDTRQVVQQFRFGPYAVRQAVIAARYAVMMAGRGDSVALADVWDACRRQAQWQLDDLAQRIEPAFSWEDLVLPADVEAQLREVEAQVRFRHLVYGTWGYEQRLNRGRGISALFAGASGTGKTMAAEVLASELKLPLYRIDLAGVVNKYVGETEKNLRRIFQAAEQSGTVLFFDEADALFGKRTDVKDSHDRYANIEVNYLLQLMENYSGLAILATNRRQAIDRAFLRRLRFVVDFVFPSLDNRRRIWRRVFPTDVPLGRIDYNQLAQMEIAGGNIHSIALNAAFLAASDGGVVQMEHIVAAARREYAKIDKLETAGTFGEL